LEFRRWRTWPDISSTEFLDTTTTQDTSKNAEDAAKWLRTYWTRLEDT